MKRTPPVSAILCTHNPRTHHLGRCLDALHRQGLPRDQWELAIVDNQSDEPLADRLDLSWHPEARILREETLGLTPARLHGIRQSQGDLLVFVDDDNVLDTDYLEVALRVAAEKPFLGAWSGQCRPEFEAAPPDWSQRYFGNLVLREFEKDAWSNLPRLAETMPCGAGLCVRRKVAEHYLKLHENGARSIQLDRAGNSLLSGGDNDLAACACAVGLGVGLIAALRLIHLMPSERLTVDYHARLAEGIHFSSTLLDAEWGIISGRRGAVGKLVDLARTMGLKPPHRQILKAAYRGRNRAVELLASQRKI
jgi:glycosyltransferase involved in cell wall biosynthesis